MLNNEKLYFKHQTATIVQEDLSLKEQYRLGQQEEEGVFQ
jgi:hypothetical protein